MTAVHSEAPPEHIPGGWRIALALVAAVTAARFVFLLISPVGLAADEAHYWDWSRTPEWSYYSKGPGIAATIAASTAVFGSTEFGVRFFAPVCGGLLALAAGLLGRQAFPGVPNVAAYAAGVVLCLPIMHGLGLMMTIDPPYLVCWSGACVAYLAWRDRLIHAGKNDGEIRGTPPRLLALAAAFGLAVGVGFLYKYTALLLVPCAVLAALLERRSLGLTIGRALPSAATAAAVIAACTLPVAIWNMQHDWLTVRHLMGHLGLPGGDMAVSGGGGAADEAGGVIVDTTLDAIGQIGLYIGGQLALAGPIALLGVVSTVAVVRRCRRDGASDAPSGADVPLLCFAWPIFVLYLGVALFTEPEGNWPVAGWVALSALVARELADAMPIHKARVRTWKAGTRRERLGFFRRKPESIVQITWHASMAVGATTFVGTLLIVPANRLPIIGDLVPLHRLNQGRDLAAAIGPAYQAFTGETRAEGRGEPLVIAARYTSAAWLAFYLPENPRVSSAAKYRGDRASAYDVFDQTRLDDPGLIGRPAFIVGGSPEGWERSGIGFEGLELRATEPRRTYTAEAFLGVRAGTTSDDRAAASGLPR